MNRSTITFAIALACLAGAASAPRAQGAVTFGRDKLKGSTKTQGDFNLRFAASDQGSVIATAYEAPRKFSVELDGKALPGVQTVQGSDHETGVVEYKDGDDIVTHLRPGRQKWGRIVLTREFSNDSFRAWRKAVLDGKVDRKSISVIFHNDAGEESMRVNFFECWPESVTLTESLNARTSAHATEKIELTCDGDSKSTQDSASLQPATATLQKTP